MESIYFSKMSGAGNDFIVIDKNQNPGFVLSQNAVVKLCDRRNGIGADGVIIIENSDEYDFEMNYYNSDGSFGSLCGNGARCAIKFASFSKKFETKLTRFKANNFIYSGEVLNDDIIKFYLNPPSETKYNFNIKLYDQIIKASFADTGSPHVVVNINDVSKKSDNLHSKFNSFEEFPVESLGKEIRYKAEFSPGGTNVNFILVEDEKVFIRTYERGVENETWACGTGAVAAALITYRTHNLIPPIKIIPKSMEELSVYFEIENNIIRNLSLTGPAKIVFTGQVLFNLIS